MGEFEDKLNSILSSPGEMAKIMDIARSFSNGVKQEETVSRGDLFESFDPKMLKTAAKLIGEYKTAGNDKKQLFDALRPYLKTEHRAAFDKATDALKLAHIAKIALKELPGGDGN